MAKTEVAGRAIWIAPGIGWLWQGLPWLALGGLLVYALSLLQPDLTCAGDSDQRGRYPVGRVLLRPW